MHGIRFRFFLALNISACFFAALSPHSSQAVASREVNWNDCTQLLKYYAGPSEPPFETIPLRERFVGEERGMSRHFPNGRVQYYTADQLSRDAHIELNDGAFYGPDKKPYDTLEQGMRNAIYVMTERGQFYSTQNYIHGYIHHSSLNQGNPVATAGRWVMDHGELVAIDNHSGHYQPQEPHFFQMLAYLDQQGIDLSQVEITLFHDY